MTKKKTATNKIVIPYTPRPLQKEFHLNVRRWNVAVCHRRFGKTVMAVNWLDPFNMKRGLNRIEAAEYIGIGTTKSDALVEDRLMPSFKLIDKRNVWDVRELDVYFDRLPVRDNDERVWHLE